jgi:hypothetical protein
MDVAPANPVRSERKQPQWDVFGSASLPLGFTSGLSAFVIPSRPESQSNLTGSKECMPP